MGETSVQVGEIYFLANINDTLKHRKFDHISRVAARGGVVRGFFTVLCHISITYDVDIRRDYRLNDNIGLLEAIKYAKRNDLNIMPLFIIDNDQVNGAYFSNRSFQFLSESLNDLNNDLDGKLVIYKGNNFLDHFENINAVFSNNDYTPYAIRRDNDLRLLCESKGVICEFYDDYTLLPLDTVKLDKRSFYKVYTPFYNKAKTYSVQKVKSFNPKNKSLFISAKSNTKLSDFYIKTKNNAVEGGRKNAWKMLNNNDYKLSLIHI